MKRRLGLVAGVVFGLAGLHTAHAQPSQGIVPDPMAAELFHSGRALIEKGDWDAGCPKFEASVALYLSASTLLNIAKCHEHYGRIATAWATYNRALVVNRETPGAERRKALEEIGAQGAEALKPRLPRLRIVVVDPPEALVVMRDGQRVPSTVLGTLIPVDPGSHTIVARARGFREAEQTINAEEQKVSELEIKLVPLPKSEQGEEWSGAEDGPRGGVHIPTWSIGVGAAGLLMLTVAAAFRVDQSRIEGEQYGRCRGDVKNGCPPDYNPHDDNARKNLDFGLFVGFGGVGLLALGTAVVGAVVSSPSDAKSTGIAQVQPWFGRNGAGATLGGRF